MLASRLGVLEKSEFMELVKKYGLSCVLYNMWKDFQTVLQMREKEKNDEKIKNTGTDKWKWAISAFL